MKTIKSKQYDKLFPWRKYMIEQSFDESLSNMRKDMPEKIKKKLLKYLKENGQYRNLVKKKEAHFWTPH